MNPPIETEPQEIAFGGHRFQVWVRVFGEIAEEDVRRMVKYEEHLREHASIWHPYDAADGEKNIAASILNGATVGVRYMGPANSEGGAG